MFVGKQNHLVQYTGYTRKKSKSVSREDGEPKWKRAALNTFCVSFPHGPNNVESMRV